MPVIASVPSFFSRELILFCNSGSWSKIVPALVNLVLTSSLKALYAFINSLYVVSKTRVLALLFAAVASPWAFATSTFNVVTSCCIGAIEELILVIALSAAVTFDAKACLSVISAYKASVVAFLLKSLLIVEIVSPTELSWPLNWFSAWIALPLSTSILESRLDIFVSTSSVV
jgi:hypothetical protein